MTLKAALLYVFPPHIWKTTEDLIDFEKKTRGMVDYTVCVNGSKSKCNEYN